MVLLMIIGFSTSGVLAQSQNMWSPQQRISYYADDSGPPILLTDQNKTVHAFNFQSLDGQAVILYRQWTLENGWTDPVDVILGPNNSARLLGAYLDQAGIVHLSFFSGNDRNAEIYYSKAPLAGAENAQNWSPIEVIGEQAGTPATGGIIEDNEGTLYVIYSGKYDGVGLYFSYSEDGGDTWSETQPMFLTYSDELWPSFFRVEKDRQGRLHATWTVVGTDGNGEAVYYSKLEANSREWSLPLELATAQGFEADTAALIEYNDELIVLYHNDFPTTRWMRRSFDGGQTWTDPVRPFAHHVGSNGAVSFVIDSRNTLHAFFGNRTGNPAVHGMWHSLWLGDRWGDLEAVVSGPRVQDEPGRSGFDPSFANAVVSQGNVILLTWGTDPGAGPNGAWYSYITLDTPELPVEPLPTIPPTPTVTPFPTPTSTPQPTPTLDLLNNSFGDNRTEEAEISRNPATPLLISVVPVVLAIVVVIVVQQLYSRNQH